MSKQVTVADVCDFWERHAFPTDKERMAPRVRRLRSVLGAVAMSDLRRKQLWDTFGHNGWAYRRDSLEVCKRIFTYAVKPRGWVSRDNLPVPILASKWDNPLEAVVVNLKRDCGCWKASEPTPLLVAQMTEESEAAWEFAQRMKAAEMSPKQAK